MLPCASIAVTVTVNAVPLAAEAGATTTRLAAAPGLTVIAGLVSAVLAGSVTSDAVTVREPAVLRVTLKLFVPPARAALAGRTALLSLLVMATVSVTEVTRFQ